MSNVKITVQIKITPTDEAATALSQSSKDGSFSIVLHDACFNINALEQGLLNTTYPALRASLSQALEEAAEIKAREAQREYSIVRRESDYEVDGEIGRFSFGIYDVYSADGKMIYSGTSWLPEQHGKQKYLTTGFKEISMFSGSIQRSYRKTVEGINRIRHHDDGGTPLNTLRDQTEREGTEILNTLEQQTNRLFEAHAIENDRPSIKSKFLEDLQEFTPKTQPKEKISKALKVVEKSMKRRGFDDKSINKVKRRQRTKNHESKEDSINVSIDDVGAKKQKEKRKKGVISKRSKNKRPAVQNTVAQIERPGQAFTLTGTSVMQVLRFLLAFLLSNSLWKNRICLFTDGQRSLQDAIVGFFTWHPYTTMILDWYHVVKKFKEGLSLACCGKVVRNKHVWGVLRFLWYGMVKEAIEYLQNIPATDLKNPEMINKLIGYLKRNRKNIPCYALRKALGLQNSSNPAERMNNILTASRQKRNGMSWSKTGSHALTALTSVVCNKATKSWLQNKIIPLVFVDKQLKAA